MNTTTKRAGRWFQVKEVCATQIAAALVGLCLTTVEGTAQIYSVLHDFHWSDGGIDGIYPQAGLAASGDTLYGTTWSGGTNGYGTLFKVNIDGSGYAVLRPFPAQQGPLVMPVVACGQILYGSADHQVFRLNSDGSGFTFLKVFANESHPGPLLLSGTNLYGVTSDGGDFNLGRVFKMNTDGGEYSELKSFTGSDGANPLGGMVLLNQTLYGTTYAGGVSNVGVVFQINTDGSGFEVIKHFTVSDGATPQGGLLLSGTQLYGTTSDGGKGIPTVGGTVFKINTDDNEFTVLKDFSTRTGQEGCRPQGSLVLRDGTLYGATYNGGTVNPERGTLFKVSTNGTDFAVLRYFNGGSLGANPRGNLVLVNDVIYGAMQFGGVYDSGALFALFLTPPSISPEAQTAESESTARFQVNIPGSPYAQYQWFLNGTNAVGGMTTRSWLKLTNVQPAQAGLYTAVITQAGGAMTSAPALLSVISKVPRKPMTGIRVAGEAGSSVCVDYTDSLGPTPIWTPLGVACLTGTSDFLIELADPLPAHRFYRAWQTGSPSVCPSLSLHQVPAITLTGNPSGSVRVDYVNRYGPTDAWNTLDTVVLTNTSQLYFDTSALWQPERLYRLVPAP